MSSADGCSVSGARKRIKISRNGVPAAVAPSSARIDLPTPTSTMKSPEATTDGDTTNVSNDLHTNGTPCHHEQLLKSLTVEIDAMRTLLTCQVCHRLMYQPFTLTCGHSFCYTCIDQWMHHKKECPGCRTVVKDEPTASIVLRELVLIFASRNQLLEDGETADEHDKLAKEERELVIKDEANTHEKTGGRFKGLFRKRKHAFRDYSDNVVRCPDCMHELDDNVCNECGFDASGDFLGSDEEDDELDAELDDQDDLRAMGFELSDSESDNGSENHDFGPNGFITAAQYRPVVNVHPRHRYGGDDDRVVIEVVSDDEDDEEEDDDEEGSEMEDFIVDDDDVADGTAISDDDDDATMGHRTPARRAYVDLSNVDGAGSEDDSDEGPVARQGNRGAARSHSWREPHGRIVVVSDEESSEDESGTGVPSHGPAPFSPLQGEVDAWGDVVEGRYGSDDNDDEEDVDEVYDVDGGDDIDEEDEDSEEELDDHEDFDDEADDDDDHDEDVY